MLERCEAKTLESWACGIDSKFYNFTFNEIVNSDKWCSILRPKFGPLKVVVADEASMQKSDYWMKLIPIIEHFGGRKLQFIFCGDFCQLPAHVGKGEDKLWGTPLFQTELWRTLQFVPVNFTKVYRQSEVEFVNVLNQIRMGNISKEVMLLTLLVLTPCLFLLMTMLPRQGCAVSSRY